MDFIPAPSKSYTEIYQDSDLKYAFAVFEGTTLRQVHDFIKCRDFFNEAVVSCQIGCECPSIWGFKYPSLEYPLDTTVTNLVLKGANFKLLFKNLPLLNAFEEEVGINTTQIEPIKGTDYYFCRGAHAWIRSTVMISLYTHFLRVLYQFDFEADDFQGFLDQVEAQDINSRNAVKYQRQIAPLNLKVMVGGAHRIFPDGCLPLPDMKSIDNISHMHNNTGMVSWTKTVTGESNVMEDYYRESQETYKALVA